MRTPTSLQINYKRLCCVNIRQSASFHDYPVTCLRNNLSQIQGLIPMNPVIQPFNHQGNKSPMGMRLQIRNIFRNHETWTQDSCTENGNEDEQAIRPQESRCCICQGPRWTRGWHTNDSGCKSTCKSHPPQALHCCLEKKWGRIAANTLMLHSLASIRRASHTCIRHMCMFIRIASHRITVQRPIMTRIEAILEQGTHRMGPTWKSTWKQLTKWQARIFGHFKLTSRTNHCGVTLIQGQLQSINFGTKQNASIMVSQYCLPLLIRHHHTHINNSIFRRPLAPNKIQVQKVLLHVIPVSLRMEPSSNTPAWFIYTPLDLANLKLPTFLHKQANGRRQFSPFW